MSGIVIVLPRQEDGETVKGLLVRNGYQVNAVCSSVSQALVVLDSLEEGIIICGYRMVDMFYSELYECMPKGFEMLLMASGNLLSECRGSNIMCLEMPFAIPNLISTVELMLEGICFRRRKRKEKAKERKPEDKVIINKAKALLMSRNNMTEQEAHRYIQKCSMDNSTNMVETAQMVLAVMS